MTLQKRRETVCVMILKILVKGIFNANWTSVWENLIENNWKKTKNFCYYILMAIIFPEFLNLMTWIEHFNSYTNKIMISFFYRVQLCIWKTHRHTISPNYFKSLHPILEKLTFSGVSKWLLFTYDRKTILNKETKLWMKIKSYAFSSSKANWPDSRY